LTTGGKSNVEIDIPIVIFIKSEKEALESFRQLLNIINFIIVNDDLEKEIYLNFNNINNFKKVQLVNLFYFLFSLPHTSPHSQVKLKINKEIIIQILNSNIYYILSKFPNCLFFLTFIYQYYIIYLQSFFIFFVVFSFLFTDILDILSNFNKRLLEILLI
jgi:hypothetical protein